MFQFFSFKCILLIMLLQLSHFPQLLVTYSATHKQIAPFWSWFPGGWACVCSRTLWVSPTNCPVRLGVLPATSTPTGVFSHRFWGFISPRWSPRLHGLSHSPVVPPGIFARECGTARSASHHLAHQVLQLPPCLKSCLPQLPISAPPTGLDECFFFNSLVVGLSCSLIFWQFWLFFGFKFVVVLVLVVQGGTVYRPTPPSWLNVPEFFTKSKRRTDMKVY